MDIATLKKRITEGKISDDELSQLLTGKTHAIRPGSRKSSFFNTLLKGIKEGYTEPMLFRTMFEFVLLLVLIAGIIFLSCTGIIPVVASVTMLAFVLGFLFAKFK
jgi:hypothetical protein